MRSSVPEELFSFKKNQTTSKKILQQTLDPKNLLVLTGGHAGSFSCNSYIYYLKKDPMERITIPLVKEK